MEKNAFSLYKKLKQLDWSERVTRIEEGIVNSARDYLDIYNPSRLMEDEVGTPIIDGIVRGLEKNQFKLSKASATQNIDGVFIVSPSKRASFKRPSFTSLKIFGKGRSGVKVINLFTASGLRTIIP